MARPSTCGTAAAAASALLILGIAAVPAAASPTPRADAIAAAFWPEITASPTENEATKTRRHGKRNILSDVENGVGSILTEIGSAVPSFVASGVPNFFQDFPDGTEIISKLGLTNGDIDALPTQVLNLPPYANWTDKGWNVRFHGNVYKQPSIPQDKLDDLANVFLIDVDIEDLPPSQQAQARNLTSEIFVVQQDNVEVVEIVEPRSDVSGGTAQQIQLPYNTTDQGDFDVFVPISTPSGSGIENGSTAQNVQNMTIYAKGTQLGNATAYLVPPTKGLFFVSDIDDILRVTKIYQPKEGLLNSFARPFTPWMNMPSIYSTWKSKYPTAHFHYLTTTPEQITRNYMQFIFADYPLGSFDTRPLNFSDVSATLSIRKFLLEKVIQTFPTRKFVLIADTSNSDVMKDYPLMAKDYPGSVQCILLRNTSATDDSDKFPYDTSGFEGLNTKSYMFFRTPDDLAGLDLESGNCVNTTFAQNVTFDWQGLPFDSAAARVASPMQTSLWAVVGSLLTLVAVTSGSLGL